MTCSICKASPRARATLNEANLLAPNRKRDSDGTCASASHHAQNPTSDHEPWPPNCWAFATDTTHDPASGMDMRVARARLGRHSASESVGYWHPALRYSIFDGEICFFDARNGYAAKQWQPYHVPPGGSSHPHHMHTSWQHWAGEDTSPFWYYALNIETLPPVQPQPQPPSQGGKMGLATKLREVGPGQKRKIGWVTQTGITHNGLKYETYILIFADQDTPSSGRLDIDGTLVGNWSCAGDTPAFIEPDRGGPVEVTVDPNGGPVLVEVREESS